MQVGDLCFIYHSSTEVPGIAGIAKIVKAGYPDPAALDRKSAYYDPKPLKNDEPARWFTIDVQAVQAVEPIISLAELRSQPHLQTMLVLKRGMRLSVQPVSASEWRNVCKLRDLD